MGRLTTLKPRVAMAKGREMAQVSAEVWHGGATSSTARGYGYKWQKAREAYLAKYPLCAECQRLGLVTVATDLDHIVPHKGDMVLFWDRSNWQGLCHPCHSTKTSTEDGGFGNRPKS